MSGEQEIKNLKRKMQRELVYRAMKMQRFHEPDSVKRLRKKQETARRIKKFARKKYMND
ncbi:MAG: 30S ribosomal protein S21 [Rickettsia endosymbiont of Bryobia graminum]|nr:30S ribosomal protein S21 [Rickettsia endosymbiont of Bryobia graminum]